MDRLPVFDAEEEQSLEIKMDSDLEEVIPPVPVEEDTNDMFVKPRVVAVQGRSQADAEQKLEVEQKLDEPECENTQPVPVCETTQKPKRGRPVSLPEIIQCECGAKIKKKGLFIHKRSQRHQKYLMKLQGVEDEDIPPVITPEKVAPLDYDKFRTYMDMYEDQKESKRQRLQREKEEKDRLIQERIEEEQDRERFYREKFEAEQKAKQQQKQTATSILSQPSQPTFGKYSNYF